MNNIYRYYSIVKYIVWGYNRKGYSMEKENGTVWGYSGEGYSMGQWRRVQYGIQLSSNVFNWLV